MDDAPRTNPLLACPLFSIYPVTVSIEYPHYSRVPRLQSPHRQNGGERPPRALAVGAGSADRAADSGLRSAVSAATHGARRVGRRGAGYLPPISCALWRESPRRRPRRPPGSCSTGTSEREPRYYSVRPRFKPLVDVTPTHSLANTAI